MAFTAQIFEKNSRSKGLRFQISYDFQVRVSTASYLQLILRYTAKVYIHFLRT